MGIKRTSVSKATSERERCLRELQTKTRPKSERTAIGERAKRSASTVGAQVSMVSVRLLYAIWQTMMPSTERVENTRHSTEFFGAGVLSGAASTADGVVRLAAEVSSAGSSDFCGRLAAKHCHKTAAAPADPPYTAHTVPHPRPEEASRGVANAAIRWQSWCAKPRIACMNARRLGSIVASHSRLIAASAGIRPPWQRPIAVSAAAIGSGPCPARASAGSAEKSAAVPTMFSVSTSFAPKRCAIQPAGTWVSKYPG
eukprot:SAG22_NODE_2948_length_2083_cov_17.390121_3_plen_256_part_00